MEYQILNGEQENWDSYCSGDERADIFHHQAWMNILSEQYGFKLFFLVSRKDGRQFSVPFMETRSLTGSKRWVSLPFSDYTYLLNSESVEPGCWRFLSERAKENGIGEIEIRGEMPGNDVFKPKLSAYNYVLKLDADKEKLFKTFHQSQVQRGIKKSQREGLTAVISTDWSAVEEFYRLHLITRRRLGTPVQPVNFFKILWERLIKPGIGFVVLIKFEEKAIAGGIIAGYKKRMTYKFGASHPDYLQYRPNHLMQWTAIQEAVNRGYEYYDFGRTDFDNEGLQNFKAGWGTVQEPLVYSYWPDVPGKGFMSKLKANVVTPIIKRSPLFVCRIMGEYLYKYFG